MFRITKKKKEGKCLAVKIYSLTIIEAVEMHATNSCKFQCTFRMNHGRDLR
jgi:hypothetical protein